MKRYAKYLAGAIALATVGFLLAVGLLSVIFSAKTGTYAPSTSADAASWVQAIGSIAAILSAYHLGGRQAAEARRQADLQAFEKASRREAILVLIETTCDRVLHTAKMIVDYEPGAEWAVLLPVGISEATSGLDTLRGIPHAEFDPPERVKYLSEIRAAFIKLVASQQECATVIDDHLKVLAIKDYLARAAALERSELDVTKACEQLRAQTRYIASVISLSRNELRATRT